MRQLTSGLPALALFALAAASLSAQNPADAGAYAPIADPIKAGQELAAELRSSMPAERSEFKGVLKVRKRGEWTNGIPVTCQIIPGATDWRVIYQTESAPGLAAERFVVVHTPGQPNEYWYARAVAAGERLPEPARLAMAQAATPLAGTDFWLLDLGLDFFHWPIQRVLKSEMRRGRVCRVLESAPPVELTAGYGRVLSWIDKETGGVIQAEAYDRSNKLLKEFAVRSFKKVDGVWQLKDMDIRTVTNSSLTRLEFELTAK